jgi:2,5-dihydroxypyridine 5,6-dioxygenase
VSLDERAAVMDGVVQDEPGLAYAARRKELA